MVVGWLVGGWSCRGVGIVVKAGLVVKRRAWFYFVIVIDGIVRETLIFLFLSFLIQYSRQRTYIIHDI